MAKLTEELKQELLEKEWWRNEIKEQSRYSPLSTLAKSKDEKVIRTLIKYNLALEELKARDEFSINEALIKRGHFLAFFSTHRDKQLRWLVTRKGYNPYQMLQDSSYYVAQEAHELIIHKKAVPLSVLKKIKHSGILIEYIKLNKELAAYLLEHAVENEDDITLMVAKHYPEFWDILEWENSALPEIIKRLNPKVEKEANWLQKIFQRVQSMEFSPEKNLLLHYLARKGFFTEDYLTKPIYCSEIYTEKKEDCDKLVQDKEIFKHLNGKQKLYLVHNGFVSFSSIEEIREHFEPTDFLIKLPIPLVEHYGPMYEVYYSDPDSAYLFRDGVKTLFVSRGLLLEELWKEAFLTQNNDLLVAFVSIGYRLSEALPFVERTNKLLIPWNYGYQETYQYLYQMGDYQTLKVELLADLLTAGYMREEIMMEGKQVPMYEKALMISPLILPSVSSMVQLQSDYDFLLKYCKKIEFMTQHA